MPVPESLSTINWRVERARVAAMSARPKRGPDDPQLNEARRRLRLGRWVERVEQLVSEAPPLTPDQREYIAGLLRAGAR